MNQNLNAISTRTKHFFDAAINKPVDSNAPLNSHSALKSKDANPKRGEASIKKKIAVSG